jgi:outer membrane protein insertion porin family
MSLKSKFIATFFVSLLASFLVAQSIANKPIISEVKIRQIGEVPVDEGTAKEMIFLQKGMEFDALKSAVDVKTLMNTERYSKVNSLCEFVASDKVTLIYEIEGRYRLMASPVFNGINHLSSKQAIRAAGIEKGSYVDQHLVNAAAIKVRKEYLADGFRDCTVEGKIVKIADAPEYVEVHFDVVEGGKTKVARIEFEGNTVIGGGDLRRFSGQRSFWNPMGWFSKKRVSDFDLELLRSDAIKQYRELGYLDAKISKPNKAQTNNVVYISFDIDEGNRYTVGDITFEGMKLFQPSQMVMQLPLQKGEVASSTVINAAKKFVEDSYSALGYIDTSVEIIEIPSANTGASTMDFLISVKESEKTVLEDIVIRGNTRTKDKVLRRELLLAPGDVYSGVNLDRSIKRLQNLGYFADVSYTDVETGEPNVRDLIIEVEERGTGSVMVGCGYSSVDHLIGFFEISESNFDLFNWGNFRGAGQKARLNISASSDNTDVEASFTEPWLFDRRLALNLEGYYRTREYSEYDQTRAGGSIGVSKHIPWVGRVGLFYNLERVTLENVLEGEYYFADHPEDTFRYSDEDDKYLLGSLKLSWTFDTRNNPMIPTSGTRAVAYGKLYNSALGSDYDMYELDFNFRNYQTLPWGHVLSLYAHAKVIDSFDDETIPIGNRYFLGGGRETRGYKYRDIGPKLLPKDENSIKRHRPYGGQTFLSASVEYTIPLTSMLRFATFYDIGNVWEDPYDFDFSEYAHSVGCGLRIDVPGFPVRLDFAHSLGEDDDYTRTDSFVFWMGFDN